jgi:hypothetical protein
MDEMVPYTSKEVYKLILIKYLYFFYIDPLLYM